MKDPVQKYFMLLVGCGIASQLVGCKFTEDLSLSGLASTTTSTTLVAVTTTTLPDLVPTTTTSTTTTTTLPSEYVIGQNSLSELYNYERSLNYVQSVKLLNDKVLALSRDDQRVQIWNTFPTQDMQKADIVVGDIDLGGAKVGIYGKVSADDLNYPFDVEASENKVFISDQNNHRVLIYNSMPSASGPSPNLVLGQSNMTGQTANSGGVSASSLNGPSHLSFDGTRLIVVDTNNHRVLVWNSIPTVNNQAADLVLGQANFTTVASGTTASTLKSPMGVHSDGTKLYIADTGNHRVLIWNTFPTSNGQAADLVLGQTNFTSGGGNAGGLSASSLSSPKGLESEGTTLAVADNGNRRILIWNTAVTGHKQAADRVVCQPNMTSNSGIGTYNNGTASNCSSPTDVSIKSGRLAVADFILSRVLIWNSIPSSNGQAANLVLGQRSPTAKGSMQWGNEYVESASSLHFPGNFSIANNKLAVMDSSNNRVLLWNSVPEVSGSPADIVLGQVDFSQALASNRGGAAAADTFNESYGVWTNGSKVVVADSMNSRVLIWNSWPTVNNQPADLVLGQPNFAGTSQNNGGRTASRLSRPFGVCSDGQKLVVLDTYNNRSLIWNSWPTVSAQAADLVLGQSDFVSGGVNAGGMSKSSMYAVWTCFTDGSRLAITDPYQNRVLIWNTFPTANKQAADIVLGQVNGASGGANQGLPAPTSSTLSHPRGVSFYDNKILISDVSNTRVLKWNSWPTADGQAADEVFGQPGFVTSTGNFGGLSSATSFANPACSQETADKYFFLDGTRARLTVKRKSP